MVYTLSTQLVDSYESHITLPYPTKHTQSRLRDYKEFGERYGWSSSWIDGDPLLGEKRHFYFTKHDIDVGELTTNMWALAFAIKLEFEMDPLRMKIEHILFDQRQ